jgi:hypothetical protein
MNEITQLQGVIGYTISSFFCLYVTIKTWKRTSNQNSRWAWFSFFLISSLLAVEIQLSLRFLIKPYFVKSSLFFMTYAERNTLQGGLIMVVLISLIAFIYWLIVARGLPLSIKLALTGSVISILLFVLAVISMHAIDAIFYAPLLHVFAVCWLWNIGALVIVAGVCIEAKNDLARTPSN